ncbi:MAG TPA: hypothetical protein VHB70_18665 [Parafilimonas sp.]|nr:hypothetical protein [Parafilimonas sp.]
MKLVELKQFSGEECTIYTWFDDKLKFDTFINELRETQIQKLILIAGRIKSIGQIGASANFFKLNEWAQDEKICCLYDDDIRLFCIRFKNEKILILGGGGVKGDDDRAWQDDAKLNREGNLIIEISKIINKKLENGSIYISSNGKYLLGDLNIP